MNRGMEIAAEVADSARSTIVEQVANGVSVRMAVLYLLLGGGRQREREERAARQGPGREPEGASPAADEASEVRT